MAHLREISLDAYEGDPGVICPKVLWDMEYEGVHTIELGHSAGTRD